MAFRPSPSRSVQARLMRCLRPGLPLLCPRCHETTARRRRRTDIKWQSTTTQAAPDARRELHDALRSLERQYPSLVNLSWMQLALQGLEQAPGKEVVRVAVLGLAHSDDEASSAGATAKRVLKTLLADALSAEQPWERELDGLDARQPVVVRVSANYAGLVSVCLDAHAPLREVHVSSPQLNGLNVEFLLMGVAAPGGRAEAREVDEAVMVPMVQIASAPDRHTPLTTPVHQALLVGSELAGAVDIAALPLPDRHDCIKAVVNIPGVPVTQLAPRLHVIDVALAEQGVAMIRQGAQHAVEYERLWFASNVPPLLEWLQASARARDGNMTKPAVRRHIAALLNSVTSAIEAEEADAQQLETMSSIHTLPRKMTPTADFLPQTMGGPLGAWAQAAHAELRDQLDLGFTGRRWRKLGWWKLFWRVDDVAMLTSEMLSQRFLPTAEQELVYLAGRIAELAGEAPCFPQPRPLSLESQGHESQEEAPRNQSQGVTSSKPRETTASNPREPTPNDPQDAGPKWPGHIAFTRRYLHHETVPALQSRAQSLVAQALATSAATSSLAALLYLSAYASTLYEAGAVAALGLVYSLSRLQKRWHAARCFWEGEVREEGRKAIRGAEASVAAVLRARGADGLEETPPPQQKSLVHLRGARELVKRAEEALARIK